MKIKLHFLIAILISFSAFSQVSSCSDCDNCGTPGSPCDIDPRFNGDPNLCYTTLPECGGIPINENSYILLIAGFSIFFIIVYRKKAKLFNISNNGS